MSNELSLDHLLTASKAERMTILQGLVRKHLAELLALDDDDMDNNLAFVEMGLDSLAAVQLGSRLSANLQERCKFPSGYAFNYPTVNALAQYIDENLTKSE